MNSGGSLKTLLHHHARVEIIGVLCGGPVGLSPGAKSLLPINSLGSLVLWNVTTPATGSHSLFQEPIWSGCIRRSLMVSQLKHIWCEPTVIDVLIPHFLESVESAVFFIRVDRLRSGCFWKLWSFSVGFMLRPCSASFAIGGSVSSVLHFGQVVGHFNKVFVEHLCGYFHRVNAHFYWFCSLEVSSAVHSGHNLSRWHNIISLV